MGAFLNFAEILRTLAWGIPLLIIGVIVDHWVRKKQLNSTITVLLIQLPMLISFNWLTFREPDIMNTFNLSILSYLVCAIPLSVVLEKAKDENKDIGSCFGIAFIIIIASGFVFMGLQVLLGK